MEKSKEEVKSGFDIKISNPRTFQAIARYANGLRVAEKLRLESCIYSITEERAIYWERYLNEKRGPIYSAVNNGYQEARIGGDFVLGHLNMSIGTLGRIMRERKPKTFEELAFWSAIYCDIGRRGEDVEGYEIGHSVTKYAQWLWRVGKEYSGSGIPFNCIDDSAICADNVRFVYFSET